MPQESGSLETPKFNALNQQHQEAIDNFINKARQYLLTTNDPGEDEERGKVKNHYKQWQADTREIYAGFARKDLDNLVQIHKDDIEARKTPKFDALKDEEVKDAIVHHVDKMRKILMEVGNKYRSLGDEWAAEQKEVFASKSPADLQSLVNNYHVDKARDKAQDSDKELSYDYLPINSSLPQVRGGRNR